MTTMVSPQLSDHPNVRKELAKRQRLERQLATKESARAGLIAERTTLEEERHAAMVEAHLSGNSEDGFQPTQTIRLRAIDVELASLDVAIGALREALKRQGALERQVCLEVRADQREQALKRARVLVAEMFDLLSDFQRRQNDVYALCKGPLAQVFGQPYVSVPTLTANYEAWSRSALNFIAPTPSRRADAKQSA